MNHKNDGKHNLQRLFLPSNDSFFRLSMMGIETYLEIKFHEAFLADAGTTYASIGCISGVEAHV